MSFKAVLQQFIEFSLETTNIIDSLESSPFGVERICSPHGAIVVHLLPIKARNSSCVSGSVE
ncbi:Uncharacterised protein [Mycobacteroides abscessus subsp. abscessus]|nr:Uncharacterised protein [Mycobacteroides abscessus subsp. abscessus]